MDRTHLICDGTYTANASGDIGGFREISTPKESLKKSRRFENVKLNIRDMLVLNLDGYASLTFNPGKVIDFY
jgi:hypothetical protein